MDSTPSSDEEKSSDITFDIYAMISPKTYDDYLLIMDEALDVASALIIQTKELIQNIRNSRNSKD